MQTRKILASLLTIICINSFSQPFQKAASDAFMITRMAEKFHVKPRVVNDEFSNNVYTTILKKIDGNKLYFTQEDVKQLDVYRYQLDDEIATNKTNFLQLLTTIYTQRLQQADTMVSSLLKAPFNFNIAEKYTVAEDTAYPANAAAMRVKLYKNLKTPIVYGLAYYLKNIKEPAKQQKVIDSTESFIRKKIGDAFKLDIQKEMQSPGGIAQLICNNYCKAIATCYDPHSAYMTLTDRENFESGVGKKNMVFGFNLDENDDGNVTINNLQPGSAAFKSGMINKGDKIISLQWENEKPIDVSAASIEEIAKMLDADNHAKLTITFLKADGTKREVTLTKEQSTADEDDDKVKSYLLKGDKTIGYISLPSFYQDWEDKRSINGCSNDVAKEILKLKKENIDGLILDVRFNGGGSVQEAVDLTGIFIDAGPITQFKMRDPKPITLKDGNRGTIYDGPMVLLVNGFSASASELLAGALQDYHRAVIVGSTTYGKATGQSILPLDTTISLNESFANKANTFLKLSISQLYQVSGNTAQFKGVVPDILLPDATDAYDKKEKNEPFAIPANNIDANKYYIPNKPLPLDLLKEKAIIYQQEDSSFYKIKKFIAAKRNKAEKADLSLKLDDVIKLKLAHKTEEEDDDDDNDITSPNKFYTISNNSYETERIKSDSTLKNTTDTFKAMLLNDANLKIAYRLMLLMTK